MQIFFIKVVIRIMIYKLIFMSFNFELKVGLNYEGVQVILSRLDLINVKDEEIIECYFRCLSLMKMYYKER